MNKILAILLAISLLVIGVVVGGSSSLISEKQELENAKNEIAVQYDEAQKTNSSLQNANTELTSENTSLKEVNITLQGSVDSLTAENTSLREQNQSISTNINGFDILYYHARYWFFLQFDFENGQGYNTVVEAGKDDYYCGLITTGAELLNLFFGHQLPDTVMTSMYINSLIIRDYYNISFGGTIQEFGVNLDTVDTVSDVNFVSMLDGEIIDETSIDVEKTYSVNFKLDLIQDAEGNYTDATLYMNLIEFVE